MSRGFCARRAIGTSSARATGKRASFSIWVVLYTDRKLTIRGGSAMMSDENMGFRDDAASRRDLLKVLATAGVGAMLPGAGLIAQTAKKGASGNPHRIDVHHQYSFM